MHYDFKHLRDTPQELRDRFQQAGLAPGDRLPDPQPDAPRAPGADLPRRPGGRGQPPDPARGRHDQARRRRPLHPRALLREAAAATIPSRPRRSSLLPLAMRMAGPREARLARDHPQELRLHPPDRRPRPCRPRQRQHRQAVLRPLRRAGAVRAAPGRARHHDGAVPRTWSTRETRAQYVPEDEVEPGETGARRSPAPSCAAGCRRAWRSRNGSPSPRWSRSCAAPIRRATGRASPSSSPASRARASRPSPTRSWSSCWSWAAGR